MLAEEESIEAQLEKLSLVRRQFAGERSRACLLFDQRRDRLHHLLRASAPSAIAEAIAAFEDDLETTLRQNDYVKKKSIDGRWVTTWSNYDSVQARAMALRDALGVCKAELPLIRVDTRRSSVASARLRSSLPAVAVRPGRFVEQPA